MTVRKEIKYRSSEHYFVLFLIRGGKSVSSGHSKLLKISQLKVSNFCSSPHKGEFHHEIFNLFSVTLVLPASNQSCKFIWNFNICSTNYSMEFVLYYSVWEERAYMLSFPLRKSSNFMNLARLLFVNPILANNKHLFNISGVFGWHHNAVYFEITNVARQKRW